MARGGNFCMDFDREHARNLVVEQVYQAFLRAVDEKMSTYDHNEAEWQYLALLCGKRILEGAEISLHAQLMAKEFDLMLRDRAQPTKDARSHG
jgi:hypothetical protein